VHDDIADVFVVFLKNVGFVDVEYEDVWWDVGVAYEESEHRQPDITCRHATTGVKQVFDVIVWWGASAGLGEWGEGKVWVNGDEESELVWGLVECPPEFVPLGFEAGGAFGPATRDFLREVARVAGAQAFADLYHRSAMVWGEH
jgi:hypothetical protein